MTRLLALDASSDACSVALWLDGEVVDATAHVPRGHTRHLMPMIDEVLARAGVSLHSLDALAYGQGPGSFTGVRIAAGVAQGLAFGIECPLLGISTLRALALEVFRREGATLVMPALDARLGELYTALYEIASSRPEALVEPCVIAPEALSLPDATQGIVMAGSGVALAERLSGKVRLRIERRLEDLSPRAAEMAMLAADDLAAGIRTTPQAAVPVYLRDRVASSKR